MKELVVAAALLSVAVPAMAAESQRWGSIGVSVGKYRPDIDSEFGAGSGPYQAVFGDRRGWIVRGDFSKTLFSDYGTLDVGAGLGYWEIYGRGLSLTNVPTGDGTGLRMIPVRASLTYRFDVFARQLRWFPIAPYGRVSLDRYHWWINNGAGDTARSLSGKKGSGATNGYSLSLGAMLLLDSIDPMLARDMDRESGVNDVYLFIDFTKSFISDFGSSSSWTLSGDRPMEFSAGILFVF